MSKICSILYYTMRVKNKSTRSAWRRCEKSWGLDDTFGLASFNTAKESSL